MLLVVLLVRPAACSEGDGARAYDRASLIGYGLSSPAWTRAADDEPHFHVFQFAYVGIFLIALLGLNILTGYAGQISLGHGAFMGVGAYTTAILVTPGWRDL